MEDKFGEMWIWISQQEDKMPYKCYREIVKCRAQRVTAAVCPALTVLISFWSWNCALNEILWFLKAQRSIKYGLNKIIKTIISHFKLQIIFSEIVISIVETF